MKNYQFYLIMACLFGIWASVLTLEPLKTIAAMAGIYSGVLSILSSR